MTFLCLSQSKKKKEIYEFKQNRSNTNIRWLEVPSFCINNVLKVHRPTNDYMDYMFSGKKCTFPQKKRFKRLMVWIEYDF